MENTGKLLAYGNFDKTQRARLATAAAEAAFGLAVVDNAYDAGKWLSHQVPNAVLLQAKAVGAADVAIDARSDPRHFQVPMIALSDEPSDLDFAEVFSWSGDDVVRDAQTHALVGRLRRLSHDAPGEPTNGRGKALVADPDRTRRVVLGRVLRNAGYTVTFAVHSDDAWSYARSMPFDLVVASTDLQAAPRGAIEECRTAGSNATWIVTCPPRELGAQREALGGISDLVVTDGFAPAENVLFLANELRSKTRSNKRASARLLYGTTVAFRGAGREADELGYTYNISEGGMYVRTLLPPEDDQVWMELRPPRTERRVRLVGKVVWRRQFGPDQNATVPPGFGVQIIDGATVDLETWRHGYHAFATALA